MISKVTVKAPAKINLFLDILNLREDGYHNVNMVMQSVTLFDTVIIEKMDDFRIDLTFSKYKFLNDVKNIEKNTAYIAVEKFFEFTKIKKIGLKINIIKNIPVCAGLAGGSADAAAVLIGLNEMFNTKLSKADLALIGKEIGADVPFCIFGGTMLATEKGTKLMPLNYMPFCYFVLCKPKKKVSTKLAYEASDSVYHEPRNLESIMNAINSKSLKRLSNEVFNSFEEVLKIKEVEKIKNIMVQNGALSACMSGSGPTVYGIFFRKNDAFLCQKKLRSFYSEVFICQTQKFGSKIYKAE